MSLEIEFATSAQALPHHTSYQTPRRQQSHHETSSPFPSSSPPPDALGEDLYSRDKDISNDGNMSAMDPRRFTPNLHASLVAEILSLRREIESKNSVVGALEESLQETRIENGQLSEDLRSQAAEVRSVKRQMQLLEAGSHSAVGDIEKERDGVVDKLGDTQKRLETFKNKARSHEQELERSQELWTRDREVWDDEKRNLERKIHVVEGRLKTVLMEVAAAQDTAAQKSTEINHGMRETWFTRSNDSIGSYQSNGVTGRSRSSGLSNHGQDGSDAPNGFSTSSGLNGFGPLKLSGLSLAEELEFHDDDDDEDNLEEFDTDGGHASPDALPEEAQMRRRRASIQELSQDRKARKILGLLAESNGRLIQAKHIEIQENHIEIIDEKTNYFVPERALQNRDVGTQFSPPPSPKLQLQVADAPVERNAEQTENAANQRRKRVSVQSTSVEETTSAKSALSLGLQMVSAGCQTLDSLSSASITPPVLPNDLPEMTSSTTQTNDEDIFMMISAATRDDRFMTVPTIEIHPPGSRPPSSHNGVVLPPRTKSAACQVSIELPVSVRSISVQTDEIRPDKRSLKIPPRLVSVQGASKSTSWRLEEVKESTRIHPAPRKSSRRNPYRVSGEPAHARLIAAMAEPVDAYPGNNDNGPLNKKEPSSLRRPIRDQSLFAGFESASDGEAPQLPEIAFSDDDFANAPPIRKTLSKVENSWKLVPHSNSKGLDLGFLLQSDKEEDTNKENGTVNMSSRHESAFSKKQPPSKPAPVKSSTRPPNSYHAAREPNIRRTALISSGAAAHATRARSPSAPSPSNIDLASIAPPFPVPTRSSSRRIPISASDGTRSPTPYSTAFFSASRHQGAGRPPHQNAILRKVRSATAVPKFGRNYRRQSRSRSPPPPSTPSIAPESPRLPRLPHHDIPSQRVRNNHKALDSSLSSFTAPVLEEPVECHNQPPSVVDAIAQTMVGEWMWKYVRRRKSFGISESPHVEFDATKSNGEIGGGHGIRHKRWVWLAPYERAIMWSSKQPTSGSALLGKSGRKRKRISLCWKGFN